MTRHASVEPWDIVRVDCDTNIKYLRSNKDGTIHQVRAVVEKHLEENHSDKLQVYTDGSVNRARTSSTVAVYIPYIG